MGSNINFPKINVPILSGVIPQENSDQKVLFVGQAGNSLLPASSELIQNISNSENEIKQLFGNGSMLSDMLISARKINNVCEFDVISCQAPDDGGNATSTLTFSGTATASGTLKITIESDSKSVDVNVSVGDTSIVVATAVSNAIAAKAELSNYSAPVTAGSTSPITSLLAGYVYNKVGVSIAGNVAGITSTVAGFGTENNGQSFPTDLTTVLDLIGEERYQTIVWVYNNQQQLDIVKDFLDLRFNAEDQILDGVAITCFSDTFANVSVLGAANNSQSLVIIGDKFDTVSANEESSAIFEAPWVVAAQFGAIRALRRQPDANISNLVISKNGALDSRGGAALSSKPYANTPFFLLPSVKVGRGFDRFEINALADDGVMILGNNRSKTSIISGQAVTTYKTDVAGNQDISFKYLNYVDTASTGREYIFNNLQSTYSQSRLTDGNLVKGRDMANKESIAATMVGFYQVLSDEDFVVARKGEEVLQFFKQNLIVNIDLATGKADISFNLPIVTQLREIFAPMTLTFNIE